MQDFEHENGNRNLDIAGTAASNGHHHNTESPASSVNPYLERLRGEKPDEIVEYELDSDPYANMLPGISSIRAARTISRGVDVGQKRPWIMIVSVILLIVLVLPAILAVLAQLFR